MCESGAVLGHGLQHDRPVVAARFASADDGTGPLQADGPAAAQTLDPDPAQVQSAGQGHGFEQ